MLKQSKGWIVGAAFIVGTTLPVCVLAQDTTVRDTGSESSELYVNLLRRWLTNEAFSLGTDVVDVPGHSFHESAVQK